jgi:hypothetical protein
MRTHAWPWWTCPIHHVSLEEAAEELRCPRGHAFWLVNGIPRFVSGRTYSDTFGLQWRRHRRTQLDSDTKTSLSRDPALSCTGSTLFEALDGPYLLEAGCGADEVTADSPARARSHPERSFALSRRSNVLPRLPRTIERMAARRGYLDTHDLLTDWYKHFRRRSRSPTPYGISSSLTSASGSVAMEWRHGAPVLSRRVDYGRRDTIWFVRSPPPTVSSSRKRFCVRPAALAKISRALR